jgi:drug/metabolite transporter (DMT)-like permease
VLASPTVGSDAPASPRPGRYAHIGPWLVALGAALWGTESAWRIPLNDLFASDVIVFYEHVILVALFLPLVIARAGELRRASPRALGFLFFSGVAGSAVGTIFFTEALRRGNPTAVNVILNVQPILSTTAACLLFGDRLARGFFPWAALAVLAGGFLSVERPELIGSSLAAAGLDAGIGLALLCALFWGLSTVAGRGAMVELSLGLAAGLRVVIGLLCMAIILAAGGQLDAAALWPPAAQAHPVQAVGFLVLLAVLSGGVPLLIYFRGLALTRASTAGYFEMMQTLAAVVITWGFFGAKLVPHQVAAAVMLIVAVAMVQRAQESIGQ